MEFGTANQSALFQGGIAMLLLKDRTVDDICSWYMLKVVAVPS